MRRRTTAEPFASIHLFAITQFAVSSSVFVCLTERVRREEPVATRQDLPTAPSINSFSFTLTPSAFHIISIPFIILQPRRRLPLSPSANFTTHFIRLSSHSQHLPHRLSSRVPHCFVDGFCAGLLVSSLVCNGRAAFEHLQHSRSHIISSSLSSSRCPFSKFRQPLHLSSSPNLSNNFICLFCHSQQFADQHWFRRSLRWSGCSHPCLRCCSLLFSDLG